MAEPLSEQLAIGGGLYFAGVASTLIILVILAGVKPLEEMYRERNQSIQFRIRAERGKLTLDVFKSTLRLRKSQVRRFVAQPNGKKGEDAIDTLVSQISSKELATLTHKLETLPFVRDVDVVRRTVTSRSERVGIG